MWARLISIRYILVLRAVVDSCRLIFFRKERERERETWQRIHFNKGLLFEFFFLFKLRQIQTFSGIEVFHDSRRQTLHFEGGREEIILLGTTKSWASESE